jgi:hypothetical protein
MSAGSVPIEINVEENVNAGPSSNAEWDHLLAKDKNPIAPLPYHINLQMRNREQRGSIEKFNSFYKEHGGGSLLFCRICNNLSAEEKAPDFFSIPKGPEIKMLRTLELTDATAKTEKDISKATLIKIFILGTYWKEIETYLRDNPLIRLVWIQIDGSDFDNTYILAKSLEKLIEESPLKFQAGGRKRRSKTVRRKSKGRRSRSRR